MIRIASIVFVLAASVLGYAIHKSHGDSSVSFAPEKSPPLQEYRGTPPARGGRGPIRLPFFPAPISETEIAWSPVHSYETRGALIRRSEVEGVPTGCYWEQKLLAQCQVTIDSSVSDYFSRLPSAKPALMAALCKELVKGVQGDQLVQIDDPQLAAGDSLPIYGLHAFPAADGGKPSVVVYYMGEQPKWEWPVMLSEISQAPQADFRFSAPSFPEDLAPLDFWAKYPSISAAVRGWIATLDSAAQTKVISFQLPDSPPFTLAANVKVAGSDGVRELNLFWADATPMIAAPPEGYADKDLADYWLETANAKPGDVTRIRSISGLAALTPGERFSAKRAVMAYAANHSFDTEVDCRLPVAGVADPVLFTLHFQPAAASTSKECDVLVTKSATSHRPAELRALLAKSDDPAQFLPRSLSKLDGLQLANWWNRRHPARPVTEKGSDAIKVRRQIGRYLSRPLDAQWFRENYGLLILDSTEGTAWLRDEWQLPPAQTQGVLVFSADEMLQMELSLLCMDEPTIAMLKDVRLIRQKEGTKTLKDEKMHLGGLTHVQGPRASISIYDAANMNSDALFVGGDNYAWTCWNETFVHEVGHVVASKHGIEAAFNDAFKSTPAPTWYAGSAPETEFIAESFMLYVLNPKWLRDNRPELYSWLLHTCTTGQPPVASSLQN